MFGRKPTPKPIVRESVAPALHPSQTRVTDWTVEDEPQLPAPRQPYYVPAASEIIRMPQVNLASPDAHLVADITPPAVVESKVFGGHRDRAAAWLQYAQPLSFTVGAVATIAAVAFNAVPLLSFWTFLVFGLAYLIAYGLLLRSYWHNTPEGVALENVHELWGYYKREQRHRHQIELEAWRAQRTINQRNNQDSRRHK